MNNLPTYSQQKYKSKKVNKIGVSTYVVNNSFQGILQPKRSSFDIKLFMQLYKKKVRTSQIADKFEKSLSVNDGQFSNARKGFKGSFKPDNFMNRIQNQSQRQKTTHNFHEALKSEHPSKSKSMYKNETSPVKLTRHLNVHSSHQKPNIIYNLSLYRKNKKATILKTTEKFSLTIGKSMCDNKKLRYEKLDTFS